MADRRPPKQDQPPSATVLFNRQKKRLSQLQIEHLTCRQGALAHAWHLVQPDFDTAIRGARAMAQQCSRCFTIKRQVIDIRSGERINNPTYEYPDGYQIRRSPNDDGPTSTARAVRAVFVGSVTPDMVQPMIKLHNGDLED